MKKSEIIERAELIAKIGNDNNNGYHYRVKTNDWENYGKNRTYISIVETRDCSKHYCEKKYGYYDNNEEIYIAEKYGDLNKNFTFTGAQL